MELMVFGSQTNTEMGKGVLGETLEESPFVGPDTPGTTVHWFFLLVGRLTHLCS